MSTYIFHQQPILCHPFFKQCSSQWKSNHFLAPFFPSPMPSQSLRTGTSASPSASCERLRGAASTSSLQGARLEPFPTWVPSSEAIPVFKMNRIDTNTRHRYRHRVYYNKESRCRHKFNTRQEETLPNKIARRTTTPQCSPQLPLTTSALSPWPQGGSQVQTLRGLHHQHPSNQLVQCWTVVVP